MADYLTTDTELTSVADAIRTKGGTSSALVYPTGFVTAIGNISTGTNVSDTTATAGDVRTGKYFYTSAGVKTQGTIADQAAQTIYPSTSDQTIASGKYLTGTQTIKGVYTQNIDAENIKSGVTIKVGDTANNGRIKNVTGTFAGGASTSVFHFYGSSTSDESLSQYGLTWADFASNVGTTSFISAKFTFFDSHGMMYGSRNCGYSYGYDTDNYSYYDDLCIIWGRTYIDYYRSTCDLYIKLSSITSSGITIDLQNSKITEADGTVNTLSSLSDFYLEIRVAK